MDLETDGIITQENYPQLFAEVCEAMVESGDLTGNELAACVTYPEGTTVVTTPLPEEVH
jgi:hypothetical protein